MHRRWVAVLFVSLAGCGYVGPVLPPSPKLPQAVTDLKAVERGDQLVITFSTPNYTTDNLPVVEFAHVDLRIGTYLTPFEFDKWASGATEYELPPPAATTPDNPLPVPMTKTIGASDWVDKRVAIAVRTAVKKKDHFSAWSNRVVLNVVKPLPPPVVKAAGTAKGIAVSWKAVEGAAEYRVYRQGSGDPGPTLEGTSKTNEFLDATAQYDTLYTYTVIAAQGGAESLPSQGQPVTAKDIFPPAAPRGLTALGAPNSIEISWQRSPESDLKGYWLFRSADGGVFERVGDLLTVPTYSDRAVQHGKRYRYVVSALDQKGNVSERSAAVEVSY